ncbi:DUF222 domain-containing protein [Actinotalea ferrariae]|uniref:HNH endonuclease signature motif containing protein n=1 Tax=Actinotalea ferrariae TaxID=1386098 RepID=UPI001C8CBC51|nr:HNH endonuclease signature motif containing protein [Actinotalea ferrariae]MBX9246200.1 DUF222 domain-containing protein [Actinotalea ferrariae]
MSTTAHDVGPDSGSDGDARASGPEGVVPEGAAVVEFWEQWLWSVRHRVAAELEEARPGPELAARMAALEPADLDEPALVEAVAAWERLGSWVAAGQARVIAELATRRRRTPGAFVSDEVAVALSTTKAVADGKVGLALGLDRMPAAADALARGDLDVRRATVLSDELMRLDHDAAQRVVDAVLPAAVSCTAPQLRARLRRMELLRDPEGARVRHERACLERRVELSPAPDAMAWLSAYLPADEAVAIHTTLTALAGEAAPEDDRDLDQRRADALVDVTTRWLDAGVHPDGTPLAVRQGRRPHLAVTASAATLLGLSDEPGELAGYGPIPPAMARRIAARSTWEPLLADVWTGEPLARSTRRYTPTQELRDAVVARDRTCTFPGCRMPAARCDIDHITPYAQSAGEGGASGGRHHDARGVGGGHDARGVDQTRCVDQTRIDNLHALCRHHHNAKTHGGWTPVRRDDGTTRWTSPTGRRHDRPPAHDPPIPPPAPPPPDGVHIDVYPPPPF